MFLASRVTLFSCIGEPPGSRSIPSVIERVIFGWQGSLARKCKSGSTVLRGGSGLCTPGKAARLMWCAPLSERRAVQH